jgi:mannose-6-phosphate isomerase-like protein (cupin superfamily)
MILSKLNAPHYLWGESQKCDGWHLCKTDSLSVIEENMPPGTKEKLHYHERCQQVFYILSGIACFSIEDMSYDVNQGESIHILPGLKHLIRNDSDHDLKFLVVSEPPSHGDRINLE